MHRRTLLTGLLASACARPDPAPVAGEGPPPTGSSTGDTGGGASTSGTTGHTGATTPPASFRLPFEGDPHSGCIMQFPPPLNYCRPGTVDCRFYLEAREVWVRAVAAVAAFEPVALYATPDQVPWLRKRLPSDVTLIEAPLSDGWSRDTAPIFLVDGRGGAQAAAFAFNGWGGSVAFADDAAIKPRMASDLGVPLLPVDMVLEGGAVHIDGDLLVTTESCLLHPTRNPDLDRAAQEAILSEVFGVSRFLWLRQGWVPDPLTNGHVDGICAVVAPGRWVVNSLPPGSGDPNAQMLLEARQGLVDAGLEVIDLPATSLTAFHINFYLANGGVVVPVEGTARDDVPMGILRDLFPDRAVVGVVASALGRAGGGIHCITQQVPADVPWPW
jgi:agmatine deiminase